MLLQQHQKYCKTLKPQRVSYLKKGKDILKFTNIHKQLEPAFVVYGDFECNLKPESDIDVTQGITDTKGKQVKYQTHEAASY